MDYSSVGIILLFILLIAAALAVALKLLGTGEGQVTTRQVTSVPMDEDKFLTTFLRPVYNDGLDEMETAVDSIRDGLDFYEKGAFVNAGEEFIDAGRSFDAATLKFREVLTLVEDPAVDYAKKARNRLIDCKRLRDLAKDMESACDAMLEERASDARALEEKSKDVKKLAVEWKKE